MEPQRYWREIPYRYRYEGLRCKKCGKIFFGRRLVCDVCKARDFETINMPRTGKIISYTIIHTPPKPFKILSPYAVAIVELDNGVRLLTQVVDCDHSSLKIGLKVKLDFRKIQEVGEAGIILYGYKAVLNETEKSD